jgi:hypothetical protein
MEQVVGLFQILNVPMPIGHPLFLGGHPLLVYCAILSKRYLDIHVRL